MYNPRLDRLTDYPFLRLATLLDGVVPAVPAPPLIMSIGEPQHPIPALVAEELPRHTALWGKYPPVAGTVALREAIAQWMERRYGLPQGMVPSTAILPVSGTREALYMIGQVALPQKVEGGGAPLVLMPNPFYQVYLGGVIMEGADPVLVNVGAESGFLPDYAACSDAVLDRAAMVFACSPANPQGTSMTLEQWKTLIHLARRFDFLLIADECYSEIYSAAPPTGVLEACRDLGGSLDHVLVFNSLSKRSSVPGLRSGFVAGDPAVIARFQRLRAYGAAGMPLPLQMVSAALWSDDVHVIENRRLYQDKISDATAVLKGRFDYQEPAGGFFLWLNVGDGEDAARRLWAKVGVKVLPGRYLAQDTFDADGRSLGNVGAPYIRIALVPDRASTRQGLERIASLL